jgi:outer membrane receptor protein involved in Fe transport
MAGIRLVAAVWLACGAAGAQSFAISGIVLDETGGSIPAATVSLHTSRRSLRSVETGIAGDFRFPAVPPGAYSVEVRREGFQDASIPVEVSRQPIAGLRITLKLAVLTSEVTAEEEPDHVSTDTAENKDATAVEDSLLDKLPVLDQDFIARLSAFLDAGAQGTSGTTLLVNGMEANNVGVTASAVKEVRINQNPYSAEFARPGRGRIEIVTKDAGAAYHGTFNFTFRDSVLNARDPFALKRAAEQRRTFEGSMTGPLGSSKKTAFLFSGSRLDDDLQAVVFARDLSGPVQLTVPSPRGLTQLAFRISHQLNQNHTVFAQYNDREYPGRNLGVGGLVLPEAATTPDHWEREVILNDRLAVSTTWVNQFQILIGREHDATRSVNSSPSIIVLGAFTTGGAQQDILHTENHVQLNDVASWSAGRHLVKFGINMPDWSRRGVDNNNNFGGTFYFSSLDDFAAARPYAFQIQQGPGHVVYWQKELGGFVQDDIKVRPDLTVALGLRYDWQNYLHDDNNFSPRVAFAYAPFGSKSTVLRGGGAIFYDRTGAGPLADLELYNGQILQKYLITNPAYPTPLLGSTLGAQPSDVVRLDRSIVVPYSIQYGFTIERQLAKHTTASVGWRGDRGIKLFRSRDANAPLPPDYLLRPDVGLGVVRQIESSGRQAGNALGVSLQGQITRYFTGLAQYTYSRTLNNTGGIAWFPANQYDLSGEWSRADFDQRHRFNLLGSFNVGLHISLGVAAMLTSGMPYTVTLGSDPYHTGLANARPAGVPRNTLEGTGYADLDLRMARDFYWSRRKKDKGAGTTLAFDAFNVFNHVNYTSYIGNLSSPFFGQAIAAQPVRRLQLTARFRF